MTDTLTDNDLILAQACVDSWANKLDADGRPIAGPEWGVVDIVRVLGRALNTINRTAVVVDLSKQDDLHLWKETVRQLLNNGECMTVAIREADTFINAMRKRVG